MKEKTVSVLQDNCRERCWIHLIMEARENLGGSGLGAEERRKCFKEHSFSESFYLVSNKPEAWIAKGPV